MDVKLTQWNKMGDHPLVEENKCKEFEYEESAAQGCGFINTFTIVYPGYYLVEINNIFVGIVSPVKARAIMIDEEPPRVPKVLRKAGKTS